MDKKKVLLGMSGGVDSSVSAIILKEQGYEVVGANLKLFPTSSDANEKELKELCSNIDVNCSIYEFHNEFKEHVINDFINEYKHMRTPNPCIECNKYMKFGLMYEKAKENDCFYIATGHYASSAYSEKYNRWVLKKSDSIKKDQSYVLWQIPAEVIEHLIFPLAKFETKDEIRAIAAEHNLKVASKPDSEDICFIPDGNYKKYLEEHSDIKPNPGNIVLNDGTILGHHNGLYNYTIGQRKGMGIAYKEPLFVIGFNASKNEVIVGTIDELYKSDIKVDHINLLLFDSIEGELKVNVKTRYSTKESPATISQDGDIINVHFDEPQKSPTPGQSAVFYIDDIVVGGGKII